MQINSDRRISALEKVTYIGLLSFMLLLPVITIITFFTYEWYCMVWQWSTVLTCGVFSLICTALYHIFAGKKGKPGITGYLLIVLMILGTVSTIFSQNISNSFFGREFREEGFIIILSYFFMFLAASTIQNNSYKRNIIYAFFVRGAAEAILAILHVYGLAEAKAMGMFTVFQNISPGFAPHPNYYGTVACMLCSLAIGFFLFCRTKKQWVFFLSLSMLFFAGVICSYARNSFLGVICALLFCIVMQLIRCAKSDNREELKHFFKRFLTLFLGLSVIFAVFYNTTDLIKNRIEMTKNDLKVSTVDIDYGLLKLNAEGDNVAAEAGSNTEISDDAGSGRIYIWKRGLQALKYYWLTGVGIDNYSIAIHHPELEEINPRYDLPKAHNEYLHIAVTEGVLTAVVYIAFLFAVFFISIRKWINDSANKKLSYLNFGLSMAFLGYISQAFFNASIIDVAPFFWIISGLLCTKNPVISDALNNKNLK